jgi:geranylgeranyl diphosphate synthase, type II
MVAPEHRAILAGYRRLVTDGMLAHLSDGRSSRYLAEYLPVYPAQPGKGLRGALVLATNQAMGGRTDQALPFAIGIELLHNAFLVHDDIIDGSRRRRDAPTLPVRYGTGLALCVGDALALQAVTLLAEAAECQGLPARQLMGEVERTVRLTIEGEAMELGWEREGRVDVATEEYLAMVLRKTSWYSTILPCRLGLLAARRRPIGERFIAFGALAGAVLQIGDDLSSYTATAEQSGKNWGDDVLEGKRSLPVIHFLATAPDGEDRDRVVAHLRGGRRNRRRADAHWFVDLLHRQGSLAHVDRFRLALTQEAHTQLTADTGDAVEPASVEFVHAIVDMLAYR